MRRELLTIVALLLPSARASADPDMDSGFVSAGLTAGYGTRGWTVGLEVSAGLLPHALEGGHVGLAGGVELAPFAANNEPWGRTYLEGEGGFVLVGVGLGPAILFGETHEVTYQVTPYLAYSPGLAPNAGGEEPFGVLGLFYRFTARSEQCPLHDGGTFVKSLWFPNGKMDRGISIH